MVTELFVVTHIDNFIKKSVIGNETRCFLCEPKTNLGLELCSNRKHLKKINFSHRREREKRDDKNIFWSLWDYSSWIYSLRVIHGQRAAYSNSCSLAKCSKNTLRKIERQSGFRFVTTLVRFGRSWFEITRPRTRRPFSIRRRIRHLIFTCSRRR